MATMHSATAPVPFTKLPPPAEHDFLIMEDSPSFSPSFLSLSSGTTAMASGGGALAEKIFNDPESWRSEESDASENVDMGSMMEGVGEREPMLSWLREEVERFHLGSASSSLTAFSSPSTGTTSSASSSKVSALFSPFSNDHDDDRERENDLEELGVSGRGLLGQLQLPEKVAVMPSPASTVRDSLVRQPAKFKRKSVHPITLSALFEHSQHRTHLEEDRTTFSKDAQTRLSKMLELPSGPVHVGHRTPLVTPTTASSNASGASGRSSPVAAHSASATLSFLEWYGIYPDSPRPGVVPEGGGPIHRRPSTAQPKHPPHHIHVPTPRTHRSPRALIKRPSSSSSSLLSPSALLPELTVEHPKRGSSVPPLRELKPMLDQIVGLAAAAAAAKSEDIGAGGEVGGVRVVETPAAAEGEGEAPLRTVSVVSTAPTVRGPADTATSSRPLKPPGLLTPPRASKPPLATESRLASKPNQLGVPALPSTSAPSPVTAPKQVATELTVGSSDGKVVQMLSTPPRVRRGLVSSTSSPPFGSESPATPPNQVLRRLDLNATPTRAIVGKTTTETTDLPPPYTRAASDTLVSTPPSVRRLPSIPPSGSTGGTPPGLQAQRSGVGAAGSGANLFSPPLPSGPSTGASSSTSSPSLRPSLPSSFSSPDLTSAAGGGQTIVFHGRSLSSANVPRSPMGGPAGPRKRSSGQGVRTQGQRLASSSSSSSSSPSSSLSRRPPVLQL